MQQRTGRLAAAHQRGKAVIGRLLLLVEHDRLRLLNRFIATDAKHLFLGKGDDAVGFQLLQRCGRRTGVVAQFTGGDPPLCAQQLNCRSANGRRFAFLLRQGHRVLSTDRKRYHSNRLIAYLLLCAPDLMDQALFLQRLQRTVHIFAKYCLQLRPLRLTQRHDRAQQRTLGFFQLQTLPIKVVICAVFLPITEPDPGGQDRLDRIVIRAEIARLHPFDQPHLFTVHQRLAVHHRLDRLELCRVALQPFKHKALGTAIAAAERNAHAHAGPDGIRQLGRDQITVQLVRRIRDAGDCKARDRLIHDSVSSSPCSDLFSA